jgi:hypothetical protein
MKKVAVAVVVVVAAVLGFAAGRFSMSAPPAEGSSGSMPEELPVEPWPEVETDAGAEDEDQIVAPSTAEAELRQRIDSLLARIEELEARVAEMELEHGPQGVNIVR